MTLHLLNIFLFLLSTRDFDSLSKENVFENNRLVSFTQTADKKRVEEAIIIMTYAVDINNYAEITASC